MRQSSALLTMVILMLSVFLAELLPAQAQVDVQTGICSTANSGGTTTLNCYITQLGPTEQKKRRFLTMLDPARTKDSKISEIFGEVSESGTLPGMDDVTITVWDDDDYRFFILTDAAAQRLGLGVLYVYSAAAREEPGRPQRATPVPTLKWAADDGSDRTQVLEDQTIRTLLGNTCSPIGGVDARYLYWAVTGCYLGAGGGYADWQFAFAPIGDDVPYCIDWGEMSGKPLKDLPSDDCVLDMPPVLAIAVLNEAERDYASAVMEYMWWR